MPSYSWAKLWIDTLDDHKVGMLSDHLWRRFFEFVLLAKELDQDGFLPTIGAIAWRLRSTPHAIEEDLEALAEVTGGEPGPGLVQLLDGCWHITNFAKRQAKPMSDAERKARQRARDRQPSRRGHKVVTARDTDQDQESDQESEEDQDQHQEAAASAPVDNPVDNSQRPLDDEEEEICSALVDLGLVKEKAGQVLSQCPRGRVRGWIEYVCHSNGRIHNPPGYLWSMLMETEEEAPRVRAPPGKQEDKAARKRKYGAYAHPEQPP